MQTLIDDIARQVTGTARLKLYKGSAIIAGRKSQVSLYRPDIATFEADTAYDHNDAGGFIKLQALRLRIRAERDAKKS